MSQIATFLCLDTVTGLAVIWASAAKTLSGDGSEYGLTKQAKPWDLSFLLCTLWSPQPSHWGPSFMDPSITFGKHVQRSALRFFFFLSPFISGIVILESPRMVGGQEEEVTTVILPAARSGWIILRTLPQGGWVPYKQVLQGEKTEGLAPVEIPVEVWRPISGNLWS